MKLIHAIIIGDEILSGKREDKHLKHVTQKLRKNGFTLNKADFITDDLATIANVINSKLNHIVFCFGGIGATPDDCTREAAARAHKLIIERHPEAAKCIERKFGDDAYPKRILMADLPYQANLIPNIINNIPGFSINDHHFMPGFPEMSWPMLDWLLETYYRDNQLKIDIKDSSVWIDNVSESQLIDLMNQIISDNKDIKLYSLPKMNPKKTLELGIKGPSKNVDKAIKEIKNNLSHLNINWRDNT
jgi:molybdopterin-biosynthesis enzyme MoeA-like protein